MSMYSLMEKENEGKIKLVNNNPVNFNAYIRTHFKPEIARYLLVDQPTELSIDRIPMRDMDFYLEESRNDVEKNSNLKLVSLLRYRKEKQEEKNYLQYRLKSGETLKDVAGKFNGVSIESIIRMNKINMNQSPPPGTLLRIRQKN